MRALWTVRNSADWKYEIGLNYGSITPTDGRIVKRQLNSFTLWLSRRKITAFWKLEFCKSGRPHFHLLIDGEVDEAELLVKWASATGEVEGPHLIHFAPIDNLDCMMSYVCKCFYSPQNLVPWEFKNVGRLWGISGPNRKPVPLLVVQGQESEIAPVVRIIKRAKEAKAGSPVKDEGVHSFRTYEMGGESMAQPLAKYSEMLGLEILQASKAKTNRARRKLGYEKPSYAQTDPTIGS